VGSAKQTRPYPSDLRLLIQFALPSLEALLRFLDSTGFSLGVAVNRLLCIAARAIGSLIWKE
jgi:hypothetical protein